MSVTFIGIAGYMGAGKSEACRILAEEGYSILDGDQLAKELMRENGNIRSQLMREFGKEAANEHDIDFRVLGSIVFADESQLKRLNYIVHPVLLKRLREMLAGGTTDTPVVFDAALIPQWHIDDWFDRLIWIHASPEVRLQRVVTKRPELSIKEIQRRMRMQEQYLMPPSEDTWTIIENDTDMAILRRKLLESIGRSPAERGVGE